MSLLIPNDKDKKEVEKYLKLFALKSTQVIIQSRLGEKIITSTNQPQNNQPRKHWVSTEIFIIITLWHCLFSYEIFADSYFYVCISLSFSNIAILSV